MTGLRAELQLLREALGNLRNALISLEEHLSEVGGLMFKTTPLLYLVILGMAILVSLAWCGNIAVVPERPVLEASEWVDPLLTHRIFIGSDGPVLISREVAPDPDFWAGVGVAGCESGWRAAIDSPTGDTGFWQLNRKWHEGRFLGRGWTWEDAKDPEKNTEIAFEIFLEQGWQPWAAKSCVGRSMGTSGDW